MVTPKPDLAGGKIKRLVASRKVHDRRGPERRCGKQGRSGLPRVPTGYPRGSSCVEGGGRGHRRGGGLRRNTEPVCNRDGESNRGSCGEGQGNRRGRHLL